MNLSVGIVGLPNTGKSTLFNALLAKQIANVAPYPFCTIDPNIGVVEVPDERLAVLAKIVKTEKIIPAVIKFVDIAGLVAGAAKGEGLGNQFLANIRECQSIIHILRAFDDSNVVHEGEINPISDLATIKIELCLADLQTLEKQKEPNPNRMTPEDKKRFTVFQKARKILEAGQEIREIDWTEEEKSFLNPLFLLTAKPALFVLNVAEKEVSLMADELAEKYNLKEIGEIIPICAKVEMELADLNPEERKEFLKELGLQQSGLEKMIQAAYKLLDLQTYLTAGEKEVRAWTINRGDKAPQAAGVIHTDFEKGFIKAKIVSYDDFIAFDGWKGAAEAGKVRLEGKDYAMQEGDVVEFVFNL